MTERIVGISLRLNTNNAPKQLADVQSGFVGVGRAAATIEGPSASAASALSRVAHYTATGLGLQVTVQWAQQAAGALFNASAAAERLGTQLAFASATPAKDMAFLQDVTSRLGLEFASTAQAFAGFAAAAKGTNLEGAGARKVFEAVAAASSVMGLSTDQASGAMLAIQQMMSKGVVSAEEFRGQLGERMPVALQAGSRALGVTTAEFSKMLESGQIIASDFLPKFATALNGLLGDAAENAAGRLDAAVNQMGNAWDRLKQKMGNAGVSQTLAGEARALAREADAMSDNMQAVAERGGGALQQWAAGLGTVVGRSVLGFVSGSSNVLNASINAVTGNVFALNEKLSLLPDTLRTNAQVTALLTPRLQEAEAQYKALQQRLVQSPDNIYIKSEMHQLGQYIAKLQEAQAAQRQLQAHSAADLEANNSRGSRSQFEREVAESTKFVQDEQAKAHGQSSDFHARLAKYQQALSRGVLSQAEYVQSVTALARENYKLSDAQKEAIEKTAAGLTFTAAKQKLINQDLLADVKSRVALQVMTEEEGAKEMTRLTIEEIQSRIQTERRLSAAYAHDPAKAAGHTNAAKLAAQDLVNTQNAGARELQAIADKRDKAYTEALGKIVGDGIERRQALESETHALQLQTEQARAHGIVIDSVATLLEREKAERYGVSLAMAEQNLQAMVGMGLSEQQIKGYADAVVQLRAMRDAHQEVANASGAKDLAQAGLEQTKRLGGGMDGAQEDPFKNWGNQLRETFATSGDGLARMVDAMRALVKGGEDYAKEMKVIKDLRDSGDEKNIETAAKNEQALIKKTERDQVAAYASMAGAAKGYFGKQTAAYKVLHGAEQALRTYQLVMSAQTMAKDLAGIGAKVSAWLAGDAAITTSAVASAGVQVAASTTEGAASAAAGVANQAKGDPYSAFPRMAAMAAMMAALGFAVSSSGGGGTTYDSFASQAANDGAGTVFGDSKAQSQSIKNSLQALESIARPELQYTSQMVMHLRSIDHALGGATGLLLSDGLLATDYQGVSTGNKGFLGFSSSSSSSSVSSEGVNFGAQSVAAAMQGVLVDAYRIIRTDWSKSSLWGLSKSSGTSFSTSWGDVTADVAGRFTSAVANMRSTAIAAAQALGRDTAAQLIDSLDTGLGKVEWKPDASFDDINKQISAVFSKLGDRMAQAVLPQIEQFALGGEGYLETLTRVSAGMEEAGLYADRFGLALASLSAVQGKSGDIAAELLRQTLVQSEAAGSGIAKILMSFTGGASDMADLYSGLQSVRQALVSMGQSAAAVTVDLLKGAGGMDALTSGLSDFESNFLTDTERAAAQQTRLAAEFARIGVLMPATAEQFKALVKTVDTSTAAGQKALGGLLSLSSGFKELLDTQASASKAAQDAADAAAKAQQDWLDKLQSAGKTISQWLTNLDSGSLSASTPQDKLVSARGQYLSGLTLARGNNQEALSGITGQAQTYLQAARDASSNEAQYMAVLAQVKSELRSLPAVKSYEGQILDALALINTSVQTDLINTVVARFTSLDANVDGLLTYSELRTGLGYTDAQIAALMAVVDTDGDKQLSATELQTAALRVGVASQIATLNARFNSLDANVDGLLTYSELRTGLGYTDAQIAALMAVVDTDGDKQLSATELQTAALRVGVASQIATLNARFNSLDANVDGLLTYSELRTGLGYTDAQIAALMAVVDSNGDGQISALEAQRAATLGVLGATQGVGSSTESVYFAATQQYQALVAMNNQTMYAVSFNTASMLTLLGDHSIWLRDIAASTAKTAANPVTVVQQQQSKGLLGTLFGGLFADGGVFDGQGIYNQPTAFTFDGGRLGVMGEEGPEAVMPLRRMSDGALGVRSQIYLVHHMAGAGADMAALIASMQAGFDRLAARIEVLDDNNNRGNAAIANATSRTAKVLDSASLGDALQVEVSTA
jgi:tape measure domain-containing protein